MKKILKAILFDLDDTLFDGDTEGEWVAYMDNNGLINNPTFFHQMENFDESYRKGAKAETAGAVEYKIAIKISA